jgi:mRNA interferase RelE/StbE
LTWTINYTESAEKQLRKMDRQIARRILAFIDERIAVLDDPRSTGKALIGATFGSYWRYRVGDYRIICDIQDNKLCILVVEIGNRKEVYQE